MNIYIMGPVGSGKSTVSELLASKLNRKLIPEFETTDLTFHRLLEERNYTNTRQSKINFQYYTFEQAYRRQFGQDNCVIYTPILQHLLMASNSLSKEDYLEYLDHFKDYIANLRHSQFDIVIILSLPYELTLERIKYRGRSEEKLSEEELGFYKGFYDSLYKNSKDCILVDATNSPEEIVNNIIGIMQKHN